ncbi:MAG: leucine-rich repeat domain-containing protein [Promethearchaeota archaeon]
MKAFLSSTSKDLKPYRKRATEALERLGAQADRMEVWGAHPQAPLAECLNKVEQCDLFVGIYAYRYGYIPPGEEKSITELEYEHAKKLEKPCFCFLVDEEIKWPEEYKEGEPGQSKLKTFKAKIQEELMVAWFTTTLDLGMKVATDVGHYLEEHNVLVEPFPPPSWTTEDFLKDYELQDILRPLDWALSPLLQDQLGIIPVKATPEALPPPLDATTPPSTWIQSWTAGWENLLSSEADVTWLQQRLQMLLRGFRGLFKTCLVDALIAVPPLDKAIDPLQQSLVTDRRGAIFAPSGTGKSHKLLYLAAYWKKKYSKGEVFFCTSPRQITSDEWGALEALLNERTDFSSPLLFLWDDLHHDAKSVHDRLAPLVSKRFKTNTWWLGGYTRSSPDGRESLAEYQDIWLTKDVQDKLLKFADEWPTWKGYFQEWTQWASQYTDTSFDDWETISTPWDVAVIAGGLDKRITDFFDQKFIEKAIYWLLAALFLLNNEDAVPFPELLHVLHQAPSSFKKRLKRKLGEENQWEEKLDDLFTDWERPKGDLMLLPPRPPPLRYDDPEKIDFPHQRLASKLWVEASEQERSLLDLLHRAYSGLQPGIEFLEQLDQPLDNIFLRFTISNKSLFRINLSDLDLSSAPSWILAIPQLQELDLSWNKLNSLCETFEQLQSLQILNLRRNKLRSLPEAFGNLTQLVELYLWNNQLSSLPESFGNLTNLKELDLYENQLNTLPKTFENLTKLETLWLSENKLHSLPESFGNLVNLKELYLQENQLSSLPKSFYQLTNLQTLNLGDNQFTTLPGSFENLRNLVELRLYNNKLSTLPESFGNLTSLQKLDIERNQLSSLPETFGNLTKLEKLWLSENKLRSLPETFGSLTKLEWLTLSYNKLRSLPKTFYKLTSLNWLNLGANQFTKLPTSFFQLTSLQLLSLAVNQFTSLPETLGQLQNLKELHLYENQLTFLPETLGNLTKLQILSLYENQLTFLPETLGQLQNLKELHLYENQLTFLPETLGNLTKLQILSLDENQLSFLPKSFGNLRNLQSVHLGGNPLSQSERKKVVHLVPQGCAINWG